MNELWDIERRLWLEGEGFFVSTVSADAVMVFPGPSGILKGEALVEGLRAAPRWAEVEMAAREHVLHEGCAILAYRANAQREGEEPYAALCMSVYERRKDGWRMVAHQHTPV